MACILSYFGPFRCPVFGVHYTKYYETVESGLQIAKTEDMERVPTMLKSWHLKPEDELAEWDIAMQEHEMTFDMLLPNYFRYSCIVLLFLVVETKLWEVCQALREGQSDCMIFTDRKEKSSGLTRNISLDQQVQETFSGTSYMT